MLYYNVNWVIDWLINFQERLTELFAEKPELSERVNIGFKAAAKDQSG